jgi:hypothetical protein
MKWKLKIKPIYECRCNGRLQTKRFMSLTHTGLVVIDCLFIINGENERYIQNLWMSRCDERLKTRVEESTYLTSTGLYDKTN